MKNKLKLLITLLALLLISGACALADDYAVVRSSSVNLRSGPDTSYSWLGSYSSGSWIRIMGESGNWYWVEPVGSGKIGYMSKNLLSVSGSSSGGTGVVKNPGTFQYLNLREYPSTDAPVLGYYYNSTKCTILDNSTAGWYHVKVGSLEGYFMSAYVSIEGSSSLGTYYVSTGNSGKLNLRSAPESTASILGQYANGTAVSVLLKGNTWWKVSVNGNTGYMMSSCLSASSSSGQSSGGSNSSTSAQGWCIVRNRNGSYANMRKTASTNSSVLRTCKNGLRFEMLIAGSQWCMVYGKSSGLTGFIKTELLDVYNASTSRTVSNGANYVNLRASASTAGSVLKKVPSGSIVTVIIPGATWCKVNCGGVTGWMMTRFLK